jgi:hypothetical protein
MVRVACCVVVQLVGCLCVGIELCILHYADGGAGAEGDFGRLHSGSGAGSERYCSVCQATFGTCVGDGHVAQNILGALGLEVDAVPEAWGFFAAGEGDGLAGSALGRK